MIQRRFSRPLLMAVAAVAVATGGVGLAQIEGGDRGVAPVASSGDFEVDDVTVDVSGKTADEARYAGWRLAQRRAWKTLSQRLGGGGAAVGDATLDGLVSGIVVQHEEIGPTRYIARLGVTFNRARTGGLLGVDTYVARSAPMLVVPVEWSGGVGQVFETRTAWQEAWARFRTGGSTVDYVRPAGTGADPLLINAGQVGRRGRGWWRTVIGSYGASDVLIPVVRLYRQWPGGPVIGAFEARHGPDNDFLGRFALRVPNEDGLPQLLDEGVRRLDAVYAAAARDGRIRADPGLTSTPPSLAPPPPAIDPDAIALGDATDGAAVPVGGTTVQIQFDTPAAAAVSAGEAAVRGVPGVQTAATTSLALGGVSIMRVVFAGSPDQLKAGLEARGFQVFGQGTTLRIRRTPQLLPPDLAQDDAVAG